MYDKLDLRAPAGARFQPSFVDDLAEMGVPLPGEYWGEKFWKPSQHYAWSGDLRQFGYPVLLHYGCKRTERANHKVEFVETGSMTLERMRQVGRSIFIADPEEWGIMRTDLTADVGSPVQWFKEHSYVQYKRITREFGQADTTPYQYVRNRAAETLYSGKSPNQFRIYNKTLERYMAHQSDVQKIIRRSKKDAQNDGKMFVMPQVLTFEERYGYGTDKIITRVERQCSGRDLEKLGLVKFQDLRAGDVLEPFERLKLFAHAQCDLTVAKWGVSDWLQGSRLQQMAREFGLNEVKRFLQENVPGDNWHRHWNKFLPWLSTGDTISHEQLTEEFQRSTRLQLVA